MTFEMNPTCLMCLLRRNIDLITPLGDAQTSTAFVKELMEYLSSTPADLLAPYADLTIRQMLETYYGLKPDRFQAEKDSANQFVMERLDSVYRRVEAAPDKLFAALQFAIMGNYIDFSALQGQVSFSLMDELIDKALEIELDMDCYESFLSQLSEGKKLLYLTDNAGEICFDRIFAEQIAQRFPHLQITFCVRGGCAKNDATREDAEFAGIPFPIVENGSAICGTDLNALPPDAKKAWDEADVIFSKGQGNTETLYGCGYNIFYAFLVKCQRFLDVFQTPPLTPVLIREKT